jgi:hypothetical protein
MSVILEEIDLLEGDSLRIGSHVITVLDVADENVTFRIENLDTGEVQIQISPPSRPK